MKFLKAALKYAALGYIAGSLAFSVAASAFHLTGEGSLIEHRAPFTVFEFNTSTVLGMEPDGHVYGEVDGGGYIGYGNAGYAEGTRVWTLCIYNPLTNWFDDIVARYDLLTFEEPA